MIPLLTLLLAALSEAQHSATYRERVAELTKLRRQLGMEGATWLGGPSITAPIVAEFDDGATIVKLVTEAQFLDEGASLADGRLADGWDFENRPRRAGRLLDWYRSGHGVVLSYRDPAGVPQAYVALRRWGSTRDEKPLPRRKRKLYYLEPDYYGGGITGPQNRRPTQEPLVRKRLLSLLLTLPLYEEGDRGDAPTVRASPRHVVSWAYGFPHRSSAIAKALAWTVPWDFESEYLDEFNDWKRDYRFSHEQPQYFDDDDDDNLAWLEERMNEAYAHFRDQGAVYAFNNGARAADIGILDDAWSHGPSSYRSQIWNLDLPGTLGRLLGVPGALPRQDETPLVSVELSSQRAKALLNHGRDNEGPVIRDLEDVTGDNDVRWTIRAFPGASNQYAWSAYMHEVDPHLTGDEGNAQRVVLDDMQSKGQWPPDWSWRPRQDHGPYGLEYLPGHWEWHRPVNADRAMSWLFHRLSNPRAEAERLDAEYLDPHIAAAQATPYRSRMQWYKVLEPGRPA